MTEQEKNQIKLFDSLRDVVYYEFCSSLCMNKNDLLKDIFNEYVQVDYEELVIFIKNTLFNVLINPLKIISCINYMIEFSGFKINLVPIYIKERNSLVLNGYELWIIER